MQQVTVGKSGLQSSRLAYGLWRIAGTWNPGEVNEEGRKGALKAIQCAYDAGYTLFDTADIYCGGEAEKILGEALRSMPGVREKTLVATKCGIRQANTPVQGTPSRWDFSKEHIVRATEASLKRLGMDMVDILMLHRPDYLADPHEIAEAFTQLQASGKVRYFGVSNFRPSLVAAVQAAFPMPLVVHQVEISLAKRDTFEDGTLDQCMTMQMTPMAWSPLAGGLLGEGARRLLRWQQNYRVEAILPLLDEIAAAHGVSRTTIAFAWLLKHPSRIMPIVGSINPERIREAARAETVQLSREDWYRLFIAAQGEPLP